MSTGVTQGTLRLDPIALYNSTGNEFTAPALWTQTSLKGLLDSFATGSRFPQKAEPTISSLIRMRQSNYTVGTVVAGAGF
jgi:hypothetical protein